MKRTLNIPVSSRERDYLIRLLHEEQESWLRAARSRESGGCCSAFVTEARDRAEVAGAIAVRIKSTVKRKPACTS